MFKNIKMIITDVDGVLTDGGMYYNHDGLAFKKFHTRDASAVRRLRKAGIIVCVVTSSNDKITVKRIDSMGIECAIFDNKDKAASVRILAEEYHIPLEQIAYIGDDYIDLEAMKIVGVSAAPIDGLPSVVNEASMVVPIFGGDGVFAYFVDTILGED
jgi:3-deoxy-D-manno-octulosonate 8-phosphate phosphatase (KDO 8-P phosphatase)